MFGGWPHELKVLPVSELRVLENYYFAVKEADNKAAADSDEASEGV